MFAQLTINVQEKVGTKVKAFAAKLNEMVTLSEAEQNQIYDLALNRIKNKAQVLKENIGSHKGLKKNGMF